MTNKRTVVPRPAKQDNQQNQTAIERYIELRKQFLATPAEQRAMEWTDDGYELEGIALEMMKAAEEATGVDIATLLDTIVVCASVKLGHMDMSQVSDRLHERLGVGRPALEKLLLN